MSTEMDLDTEYSEEILNESATAGAEADSSEKQLESVTVDEGDEEDDDEDADPLTTTLPQFRIKKIMKICTTVDDDEDEPEEPSTSKSKGRKKGQMILTKEAVLLTTVATECFVAAISEMAGRITASTKKKTLTLEHLKTALSDSEAFEFLQGCLQPSVLIGD